MEQFLWMIPLAALLFYLLRRKAIKDAREKYTRKLIKQRLDRIRQENEMRKKTRGQES